jgi:drug/metabolite transporter (DMT)-like permease
MKRTVAIAELFTAASFWGFGFIATVWALRVLDPSAVTFLRFLLASVLLVPVALTKEGRARITSYIRLAFWPGVIFAATLIVQTWGLQYTTATKSGFITTLYVIMVPFLESWYVGRRLPAGIWTCVALAFLGTALIVNVGFGEVNIGDILTLICAFFATGQIFIIGLVSPRVQHPFTFNLVQSAWSCLLLSPFAAFNPATWRHVADFPNWPLSAQGGLLSLAFGSTVVAFALQVRAQKWLSPTVSSLLFLLESPIAMLLSIWLLGEHLGWLEASGCALIFAAAVAASLLEAKRSSNPLPSPANS